MFHNQAICNCRTRNKFSVDHSFIEYLTLLLALLMHYEFLASVCSNLSFSVYNTVEEMRAAMDTGEIEGNVSVIYVKNINIFCHFPAGNWFYFAL